MATAAKRNYAESESNTSITAAAFSVMLRPVHRKVPFLFCYSSGTIHLSEEPA
jgi:hypothetical protein